MSEPSELDPIDSTVLSTLMLGVLMAVLLYIGAGLFVAYGPPHGWAVRTDQIAAANWRSENARVNWVSPTDDFEDGSTIGVAVTLRYRDFAGRMRTSTTYVVPYGDKVGMMEPVAAGRNGGLYVVNDQLAGDDNDYSPYPNATTSNVADTWAAAWAPAVILGAIFWGLAYWRLKRHRSRDCRKIHRVTA